MQRKLQKIVLVGCGCASFFVVILMLFGLWFFFHLTRDYDIAADPQKIATEAHFDLPDYSVINQFDNMDRSASAWSSYEWELALVEPLSAKKIKELDELVKKDSNWKYNNETHSFIYKLVEDERNYTIIIFVEENRVYMEYNWWDILS